MVDFDQYGRIRNRNYRPGPVGGIRPARPRSSYDTPWDHFSDFISRIGDWFEDNDENLALYISWGILGLGILGFIIAVGSEWVNHGFWSAFFSAVIGGVLGYYISMLIIGILFLVMKVVCLGLRLVFKNGVTFLITVGIVVIFNVWPLVAAWLGK